MIELFVILLLTLVNGVFAGAEIAVVALRRTRIQELAEQGQRGARAVLALRDDPERFLATVQVGITVVGATAAAFGGASVARRLSRTLSGFGWDGEQAETVALFLVIAGVSYLSLILGELVPKSLALRGAERYALLIGRPLLGLSWLAKPLVWLLSASANLVLRPFGDQTTFTETRHSAEELQELVEQAAKAGTIHPDAGQIASRALELPELTVADVMVPRQDVVGLRVDASPEELRQTLSVHAHSRLPLYERQIDHVVGYVAVKDLLARSLAGDPVLLRDVMRPPFFVPEFKPAVELLQEMRARRLLFAIVVDEQGGTSGIVTMEDLVEELVGEIFSEHAPRPPELIKREPGGSWLVNAKAPVREVNRALGIELPEDGPWTTMGGLSLALAGRIPGVGQRLLTASGIGIEIVDASPRGVRSVRLEPTHAPFASGSGVPV